MKIAIIGAGFTGLTAAYRLQQRGHIVTVFEKADKPGGLAIGYQETGWDWTLEEHYHHWFTNDTAVLGLAAEIGYPVLTRRPVTAVYVDKNIYQFDSPLEVLRFPKLPFLDRLRMAAVVGSLRYDPFWKPLEKYNASKLLPITMGKKAYEAIWEPLLYNKFGKYADDVSLAWFWARIKSRTPSLAYPEGGFLRFAQTLADKITQLGGIVALHSEIITIKQDDQISVTIQTNSGKKEHTVFDAVIVTLPSFLFLKIAPQLPEAYKQSLSRLKNLGATNLVLRLKQPFFSKPIYWLNVCDKNAPIMAIVEHTNYMDKAHYNNEHIVYLGNYLTPDHPNFLKSKEDLLAQYDTFLKKINPDYKSQLIATKLFKAPFAQPVIPTNYSKMIPALTTPLRNVYLANIEQVYPWDRGTNYAVELGEKIAGVVLK